MDIKLTCIECNRPNAVSYGRRLNICDMCAQRQLKRERRHRTKRRIETLGQLIVMTLFVWLACAMAYSWNTPNSADHRAHQAMAASD